MPPFSAALLPLLLCLAAGPAPAREATAQAGVDTAWVLSKLGRNGPARTRFMEARSSRFLKKPLRVSGEYRHPDGNTFVREVTSPYSESVTIRGDQVTMQRGSTKRSFSLGHAPQLVGLQKTFGALLNGDEKALSQDFSLDTTGTREQWRVVMRPKAADLAKMVADITLFGRGAELRCVESRTTAGELQRTLLASAAEAVTSATTDEGLVTLCHGGH